MHRDPVQPPVSPTASVDPTRRNKQKLVWALICLIGPTALLIATVLLYAVVNLIGGASGQHASAFGQPSLAEQIVNIVLFLIGALVVLTWLPGVIIGIILLASRKRS